MLTYEEFDKTIDTLKADISSMEDNHNRFKSRDDPEYTIRMNARIDAYKDCLHRLELLKLRIWG